MVNKSLGVQEESKGRAVKILLSAVGGIALIVGTLWLTDVTNLFGSAGAASSLTSTVPAIESNPGVGAPTEAYAGLIQEQNTQNASNALQSGGSSVPTIINADITGDPNRFLAAYQAAVGQKQADTDNSKCSPEWLSKAREAGVTASELRCNGCSASQLAAAGYSAAELKAAGFDAAQLKAAGFSADQLRAAGFSANDLKAAGYSASALIAAGFSASELKSAGYSAGDLLAAGISAAQLKDAGFSVQDLKAAGVSAQTLLAAGYSAAQLEPLATAQPI